MKMHLPYLLRCGNALIELYNQPEVQTFINGISSKQLHPDKSVEH